MDQGIRGVSSGSSQRVVNANWNPGNRQVNVNWNDVGNSNPKLGASSRWSLSKPLLVAGLVADVLDPAPQHFAYFLQVGHKLVILGVVDNFALATKTHQQFGQFTFCLGLEQIGFPKRHGHAVGLKNMLQHFKDCRIQRLAQCVALGLRKVCQ